jgi:hypothetical protein
MKTKIKALSLILAVLMLVSAFVACDNGNGSTETDTKGEAETTAIETVLETEAKPEVEKNNYGSEFFLWIMPDSNNYSYHYVEESENDVLSEATMRVQPPTDKGKRLKIYYMTQISVAPPTFVIFCNNEELFHFSYQRYIENCLRETFGFVGTPIKLIIRERGEDNK